MEIGIILDIPMCNFTVSARSCSHEILNEAHNFCGICGKPKYRSIGFSSTDGIIDYIKMQNYTTNYVNEEKIVKIDGKKIAINDEHIEGYANGDKFHIFMSIKCNDYFSIISLYDYIKRNTLLGYLSELYNKTIYFMEELYDEY